MKIFHYALGFPPYRTGGLIKYALDLMESQSKEGNEVGMLWPGQMGFLLKKTRVKFNNDYYIEKSKMFFKNYEIINPLPVPLMNGVRENIIDKFIEKKDINIFLDFFKKTKPDVLHVHTLMGLPIECVEAAKKLGIKTIYTSHDFYGLYTNPKGAMKEKEEDCNYWKIYNKNAMQLKKIIILQSPFYRKIKNNKFIGEMRKKHNQALEVGKVTENYIKTNHILSDKESGQKYVMWRGYYVNLLNLFDHIHFNSSITKSVYDKFIDSTSNGEIISISHSNIKDNKKLRKYSTKVKIGYFGSLTTPKGYFFLKKALDELYEEGITNFELHVYVMHEPDAPYIVVHEPYKYKELANVMEYTDMLVMPGYETFGFTVLEALSYGVPVVVSENVGSKDIVDLNKSGIVVKPYHEDLKNKLKEILTDVTALERMNNYIYSNLTIKTMDMHCAEINQLYLDRNMLDTLIND